MATVHGSRSLPDQGRGEFRRRLEYKKTWRGGFFVAVYLRNTSLTCPCGGHQSAESRKTQALFACVECGLAANANHLGALNVCGGVTRRNYLWRDPAVGPPAEA
ncbi:zinc ribbon domain-containing protein [Paraburkholderia sp. BR14320]|uniref:zinc ribbon domain-containing protein n=1 Tax=unclassified Paraburkholderia TaxID=2615204 RepID=UPI0034CF4B18